MREVLVNAYPKSGVTWLVHLICDLLEGMHQDNEEMVPVAYDHPVTSDWVIRKIHKPYWGDDISYLADKTVILTQRDPRDIVVSAMYYRGTTDLNAAIAQLIHSKYVDYLESWLNPSGALKVKSLLFTRYEWLNSQSELGRIWMWLNDKPQVMIPDEVLDRAEIAIERQSFPNMVKQLGGGRHFMRKGIVGDWANHFNREQAKYFNIHFGRFMLEQGYVDDLEWWERCLIC